MTPCNLWYIELQIRQRTRHNGEKRTWKNAKSCGEYEGDRIVVEQMIVVKTVGAKSAAGSGDIMILGKSIR